MKRMSFAVFLLILFLVYANTCALAQGTYTAATCNQSDVNAVINGPTHTAVDGDTINIPAGSCTWATGITVPDGIGITITGNGTPNSTPSTTGASASCGNTNITVSGVVAFGMTPTYGNSTSRISCMLLQPSGSGLGFKVLGTCTASGCPNLRVDNMTFSGWAGVSHLGNSYGITAVGNMFGLFDHNTVNGTTGQYLQLTEFSHANYLGIGSYGDYVWNQSEDYGSANFLFIENNIFNIAGCCENESTPGATTNWGGGRVVVRFNQFNNMDDVNFSMGWHGTESSGRPRSARAFEYYENAWTCGSEWCGQVAGARGGTGLTWGNTVSHPLSGFTNFFTLTTYRTQGNPGAASWQGACDGSSAYDINDGVTYCDGTVTATSPVTISCSSGNVPSNPPAGSPYSLHDITANNGTEIISLSGNTVTLSIGGGPGAFQGPSLNDHVQILRATACIDQAGGRGAGILYNATDPATPVSSSAEALSPSYFWSNTINNGGPSVPGVQGVYVVNGRVIRSRDFYVENLNQTAQSSSSSPFDGSTAIGMGHGTLANRPTGCTTGVGYWATDQGNWNQSGSGGQGELFICTTTNTWTLSYTPYTYPHPLTWTPLGLQAVAH